METCSVFFDEIESRNGFLDVFIIFVAVVMKSDCFGIFVIAVNSALKQIFDVRVKACYTLLT